jgi:hypothetical protein
MIVIPTLLVGSIIIFLYDDNFINKIMKKNKKDIQEVLDIVNLHTLYSNYNINTNINQSRLDINYINSLFDYKVKIAVDYIKKNGLSMDNIALKFNTLIDTPFSFNELISLINILTRYTFMHVDIFHLGCNILNLFILWFELEYNHNINSYVLCYYIFGSYVLSTIFILVFEYVFKQNNTYIGISILTSALHIIQLHLYKLTYFETILVISVFEILNHYFIARQVYLTKKEVNINLTIICHSIGYLSGFIVHHYITSGYY